MSSSDVFDIIHMADAAWPPSPQSASAVEAAHVITILSFTTVAIVVLDVILKDSVSVRSRTYNQKCCSRLGLGAQRRVYKQAITQANDRVSECEIVDVMQYNTKFCDVRQTNCTVLFLQ